jgi:hypothetical protein
MMCRFVFHPGAPLIESFNEKAATHEEFTIDSLPLTASTEKPRRLTAAGGENVSGISARKASET